MSHVLWILKHIIVKFIKLFSAPDQLCVYICARSKQSRQSCSGGTKPEKFHGVALRFFFKNTAIVSLLHFKSVPVTKDSSSPLVFLDLEPFVVINLISHISVFPRAFS